MYLISLLFLSPIIFAGTLNKGEPCSQANSRLQPGTFQFWDECNSQTFCSAAGICEAKGCRRDDFPFGYAQDSKSIPDKCARGTFCPDEEDQCLPVLALGSACQLNRDDQCEGPPEFKELSDVTGRGLNVNGSICLNNVCMWANATLGTNCVVENTPYIAYGFDGEFINIVSRDNCRVGSYCDASQKVCMATKKVGDSCTADKECDSWNCLSFGICGGIAAMPHHFHAYVYILVALGIIGGMLGTLVGLFFLHRKQRDEEREKRIQYWREQNAFHQNLLQMRERARASIRSLPGTTGSARSTMYSRDWSEVNTPILSNAVPKGSGLRHFLVDDGSSDYDEGVTAQPKRVDGYF
ncbi:hypothetical protein AMATHDRAFT_184139 [Amanita thiersii Skay4041]|uniref:Dickkopf N-terminal cysteine-rich domain-containing protein n=1 Tax=Amanita thiersii Skay4041 TaxID=703135 RepID=A0A2A9NDU7_9AGAR|nr:hypothetical protein AMATHDRAFT_184139 [Amanita thiersii Skay4041]